MLSLTNESASSAKRNARAECPELREALGGRSKFLDAALQIDLLRLDPDAAEEGQQCFRLACRASVAQSQCEAPRDVFAETASMLDRQVLSRAKDQRDAAEQIAFDREIEECVIKTEERNAALCLAADDREEPDAAVTGAGSARANAKQRATQPETHDRADLLVNRDVHLRRRQSIGICRWRSDERCFRSRIHHMVLNRQAELTKDRADSFEQQYIEEHRRPPAIDGREVCSGIVEKRLQVIVVNDRADVLDLEVLGVRREIPELDQVQKIQQSARKRRRSTSCFTRSRSSIRRGSSFECSCDLDNGRSR
jgi:hypothetical protein